MPIKTAAYRHHSPFPAKAQLSKTRQAVIVRVHCFKRRAMAQAFLVEQDTLTIASKLRGLPSPVIIHVLIDEKPSNSSPSPVIIHVFIDQKTRTTTELVPLLLSSMYSQMKNWHHRKVQTLRLVDESYGCPPKIADPFNLFYLYQNIEILIFSIAPELHLYYFILFYQPFSIRFLCLVCNSFEFMFFYSNK